jgi:hypothetical protein
VLTDTIDALTPVLDVSGQYLIDLAEASEGEGDLPAIPDITDIVEIILPLLPALLSGSVSIVSILPIVAPYVVRFILSAAKAGIIKSIGSGQTDDILREIKVALEEMSNRLDDIIEAKAVAITHTSEIDKVVFIPD